VTEAAGERREVAEAACEVELTAAAEVVGDGRRVDRPADLVHLPGRGEDGLVRGPEQFLGLEVDVVQDAAGGDHDDGDEVGLGVVVVRREPVAERVVLVNGRVVLGHHSPRSIIAATVFSGRQ
jgi:hypothetical protein